MRHHLTPVRMTIIKKKKKKTKKYIGEDVEKINRVTLGSSGKFCPLVGFLVLYSRSNSVKSLL